MLRNYFKVAFRSMWRQRQGATINILGLSMGMTVCMLIVLYVQDEWSFDRFHAHAERIYRVAGEYDQGGEATNQSAITTYLLAPILEGSFSAIEK
ncbi:MAG: ABC transporter permease [Tunicatimonas sp.]